MRNGALPLAPENPQVGEPPAGRQRTWMSMKAVRVADTDGSRGGKLIALPALRKVQV